MSTRSFQRRQFHLCVPHLFRRKSGRTFTPGVLSSVLLYMLSVCAFLDIYTPFFGARGSFLVLSARGTQGGRPYTTAQVWGPGGLRGALSGRLKSRNLASNHEVAFRGARAEQDNGKPTQPLFCSTAVKALYFMADTVQQQSHSKCVWTTTYYACVDILSSIGVCCVCYDTYAFV